LEESAHGAPLLTLIPGLLATIVKGGGEAAKEGGYTLVPYVRAAATDLNFTAALALISVIMTQVVGVRARGMDYFSKFFNVKTLWTKPFFGAMDFLVGLLETISELSKILSFTFRLFGNVFAGSVLLFLISSMLPVFMPAFIVLFEVFIGLIQAAVFGMLTMIFMSMATQGHGGHEEEHA
jgi:F-type H+-transporting ATPase subunit a